MAGEYVALSRANAAGTFMRAILNFYGEHNESYYPYTDSQAAERLAAQAALRAARAAEGITEGKWVFAR